MPCFLAMFLTIFDLRALDLREEFARPIVERAYGIALGSIGSKNTFKLRQGAAPVIEAFECSGAPTE